MTHQGPLPQDAPQAEEPQQSAQPLPDGLYLFATATCPNCRVACQLLEKAGIGYEKLLAAEHRDAATALAVKQAPTLVCIAQGNVEKYTGVSEIQKYIASTKVRA